MFPYNVMSPLSGRIYSDSAFNSLVYVFLFFIFNPGIVHNEPIYFVKNLSHYSGVKKLRL